VRKIAFFTWITSTLVFLWPVWSLFQRGLPQQFGASAFIAAAILIASTPPIFYFALFRNETPIRIAAPQRRLCLIAAIVFGLLIATDLSTWFNSVDQYLTRARAFGWGNDPETMAQIVRFVGQVSNFAFLVMLMAFYRSPEPESGDPEVSRMLDVASRVAVMASGLWLAFNLVVSGYVPYSIWQNRLAIQRSGQSADVLLRGMLNGPVRNLLLAACIFVAPYAVSMSNRVLRKSAPEAIPAKEENQDV
jgi:hypothetical protein